MSLCKNQIYEDIFTNSLFRVYIYIVRCLFFMLSIFFATSLRYFVQYYSPFKKESHYEQNNYAFYNFTVSRYSYSITSTFFSFILMIYNNIQTLSNSNTNLMMPFIKIEKRMGLAPIVVDSALMVMTVITELITAYLKTRVC